MRAVYPLLAVSLTVTALLSLRGASLAEAPHAAPRPVVTVPRALPPGPPAPSTTEPAKNAEAISLLREAYRHTADETRADQRDILLRDVCEWLAFAGDDATAEQAAKDARVIARTYKDDFEKASHLRTAARLFGLAGASDEAWATCREITHPNERDYAFHDAAGVLAKRDAFDGMWDALPEIKNESLRLFTLMPVIESCLRRGDAEGVERALSLVPPSLHPTLIGHATEFLVRTDRKAEAAALRERHGIPQPAGEIWLGPLQRFADAEVVDVDDLYRVAAQMMPKGPSDKPDFIAFSHSFLLTTLAQKRLRRGDAETARAIWEWLADEAERKAPEGADSPQRLPPVAGQPDPIPAEDRRLWGVVGRLTQMAMMPPGDGKEGVVFFLSRAVEVAKTIRNAEAQGHALDAVISLAFAYDLVPLAHDTALVARDPGRQAGLLIRVAREETFAGTKKEALETLRAAERATVRISSLVGRVEIYAAVTMARKRAGDTEGAKKALERARGNWAEAPDSYRERCLLALAQAHAEVGDIEGGLALAAETSNPHYRVWARIRMAYAYLPDARPSRRLEPSLGGALR